MSTKEIKIKTKQKNLKVPEKVLHILNADI